MNLEEIFQSKDLSRLVQLLQNLQANIVSRVHPLGFIHIELEDGFRLHLWDDKLTSNVVTKEPIHDHKFSFNSWVFFGALIQKKYVESNDSRLQEYRIFSTTYTSDGTETSSEITSSGETIRLSETEKREVRSPDDYSLARTEIHEVMPLEYPTATLIRIRDTDQSHRPRVFVSSNESSLTKFPRTQVDTSKVIDRIVEIFTAMEIAGDSRAIVK